MATEGKEHWQGACTTGKNSAGTLVISFEACSRDAVVNVNCSVNIQQVINLSIINSLDCLLSKQINKTSWLGKLYIYKKRQNSFNHAVTEIILLSLWLWLLATRLPCFPLLPLIGLTNLFLCLSHFSPLVFSPYSQTNITLLEFYKVTESLTTQ